MRKIYKLRRTGGINILFQVVKIISFSSFFILIFLIISILLNSIVIANETNWDDNWSFSEEIVIKFDTGLENAKFQPIDTRINFQNPCWGKNDRENSIRVCCWDGTYWNEIESQVYSAEINNEIFISSCNVVFLIPDFADGSEKYFIFYDDSEKPAAIYDDHVQIEDSYYKYEPISGYPLESNYFKMIDDNYIIYTVSYQGQLMGYNTCQHVTKMKEDTTEVLPKNGDLFAAFDFKYCYEDGIFGYSSTSQKLISKEILVDGNLMVEAGIVSTSKLDDLKTIATYKYYHCPTSNKRIHVHVKHESLRDIDVLSSNPETNTDGTFSSLQSGGIKSESIRDLNIGRILPFMHFYNEYGNIAEYDIDIDPEYISDDPDIRIISVEDDVDLGVKPWISFDEGETGICHSVIFSSNEIISSDTNHIDGLQINVFEMDYPHLPGFENNMATIQVGRNSFEPKDGHNLKIPKGFTVEFDAEFFTSLNNGFPIIEKESDIFQELLKIKPESIEEINESDEEIEKYDLSVITFNAPSIPMGSSLSVLLGLNLPYINVEIYKQGEFISSETATKLPMDAIKEFDDPSLLERIFSIINIFDLRNISIFKKAIFDDLEKGIYVVKIFRENPFLSKEKLFIGYGIVDLKNDQRINVVCRSECKRKLKIIDQHNKEVKDAEVVLQKNQEIISKYFTDENGQLIIKTPTSSESYDLIVYYNGIIVYENIVKLDFFERIKSNEIIININRYDFNLIVKDTWGLKPDIDLNPMLEIIEGDESIKIQADSIKDGSYIFEDLTPNLYYLILNFKSFTVNENVELNEDKKLEILFPAEFRINFKVMNSKGLTFDDSNLILNRNNKKIEINKYKSEAIIRIPPGEYQLELYDGEDLIGLRNINVYGNQEFDMITDYQPSYSTVILIISIISILIFSIFLLLKKKNDYILILIFIFIIIFSLFQPWWVINGSTDKLETSTILYLIPSNIVTIISTENTIAGEISHLPNELHLAMNMIIIFSIFSCILVIFNVIFREWEKVRFYKLSKILLILSLIVTLSIFIIAINELSNIGVGGIYGKDYLDVGVPGENKIYSVLCNWGLGTGFYFFLSSLAFMILIFNTNKSKKFGREIKNKNYMNNKNKRTVQHPLFGISLKNWIQLLENNGGFDRKYFDRAAFITLGSIFTSPARMLFRMKYQTKINNLKIQSPPVIIIGHWRSGTTFLHELLSQDPQYCYVSLWNTMLPDSFPILDPAKKFLSNFLPKTRPMDNIEVYIDGPYEEEAGIAVLSPWSFFHGLHFPKNAEEQYMKSIHYRGLSIDEKNHWMQTYLNFMKTVIYMNQGKRLLLKDPANTARIPILLEIFPDAKFIHIYRNPFKVYLSTIKMRNKVLDKLSLQNGNKEDIEKQVIKNYKRLMKSFFEQKKMISKENYVEVSYEDLVKNPLKEVRNIYTKLNLYGFKKALPGMNEYLERKKDYKTNVYKIDKKIIAKVKKHWGFTIKLWGYKPPE